MYFTLLVVVILTAIALVAVALGIARAVSPRSYFMASPLISTITDAVSLLIYFSIAKMFLHF